MRAFITGGLGFIGSNLAHRLLAEGCEVVIFDKASRAGVRNNLAWLREQHPTRLQWIEGDVRDFDAVQSAIEGADAVFHFAAQVAVTTSVTKPREDLEINTLGTFNVLEAARRLEPMPAVLYTSTNKVYGGIEHVRIVERKTRYDYEDMPYGIAESCPLDFHSPYGCSKGAADQYVRDYRRIYGLPSIVFRMSCIYGPRQFGNEDQGWLAHFILTALRGERLAIYGDGKQVRDILYVDDLVALMRSAVQQIDRTAGEIYNVGGGPANTISVWMEFQEYLAQVATKIPPVDYAPFRPGDQRVYISDLRKAQQHLGWTPQVGVLEGIRRMVYEWGPQCVSSSLATTEKIGGR